MNNTLALRFIKPAVTAALLLIPFGGWAQGGRYTITGKISGQQPQGKVYLHYKTGNENITDSAVIQSGKFSFHGSTLSPEPASIRLAGNSQDVLSFYLDKQVNIQINGVVKAAVITGSPLNNDYREYKKYIDSADILMAGISADYSHAPAEKQQDATFRQGLDDRYTIAAQAKETAQYRYISQHNTSYFSLAALKELAAKSADIHQVATIFETLPAASRNSTTGKTLSQQIHTALKTAIGAIAPDFTQPGTDGQPVTLAQFRGKYVLLDFWASWCAPCRAENPNLVNIYNTYKDRGFTILSVSLDQPGKKDAWLAAIQADHLSWTQVSDLKFWNNTAAIQYNIKFLPQNLLIDPTGRIIAKNLRGEKLKGKMEEIL